MYKDIVFKSQEGIIRGRLYLSETKNRVLNLQKVPQQCGYD